MYVCLLVLPCFVILTEHCIVIKRQMLIYHRGWGGGGGWNVSGVLVVEVCSYCYLCSVAYLCKGVVSVMCHFFCRAEHPIEISR